MIVGAKHKRLYGVAALLALALVTAAAVRLLSRDSERSEFAIRTNDRVEPSEPQVPPLQFEGATSVKVLDGTEAAADNVDAKTFACRTLQIDYSMALGHRTIPAEILRLLACGKMSEAIDPLVVLAREGNWGAVAALGVLMQRCERRGASAPNALAQESQLSDKLADRNTVPRVADRVRELLGARREELSTENVVACDRLKADMPILWEDFKTIQDRALDRTLDHSVDGPIYLVLPRKLATEGSAPEQLALARMLLMQGRSEQQKEAMQWLQRASHVLPDAKAEMAICMLQGCPTPSEDSAAARDLLLAAAAQGSRVALSAMAGDRAATKRGLDLDLTTVERYAWQQLHENLNAAGCFGSEAYLSWASGTFAVVDVAQFSDQEREGAQRAAAELGADHLQSIRRSLGCW